MNKCLSYICITALLAVIYSEVGAKSFSWSKNVPRPHLKILNGTNATEGEFPYMVQLRGIGGYFLCGGSIIGEKWILTAGHCVEEEINSIVYGTNILYANRDTDTIMKVKKSYQHPKFHYNLTRYGGIPVYDVGILELAENIVYTNKTQPLKLADSDDVPIHVKGVLTGWGLNGTYGYTQQYLQKITLPLLSSDECFTKIGDIFNGTHDLCSDDFNNGQCNGDSGSPYVINGLQYGIVSWSVKPCGDFPGTYSRISNPEYRAFIRNVTGI